MRSPAVISRRTVAPNRGVRSDRSVAERSRNGYVGPKIAPGRIGLLDERDLPVASPALEPLLARDRLFGGVEVLKVDEARDVVLLRETGYEALLVLPNSARQRAGHSSVEHAAGAIGQ